MKTSKSIFLALSSFLLVASPVLPFLPVSEVQAVADTFTITKTANDKISVVLNGTPQVQLPNGTIVTTNTTYTVKDNRTYTFVGIDGAVKVQKAITMTTVPNTAPLLMVGPGQATFLNFESGDAHSGVKDMRYVAYNEATGQLATAFSPWETFKKKKAWTVPSIPAQTSATWVVKAEFRDVAGNISTGVIGRFFIDNTPPTADISKTVTYTNKRNIDVIAKIVSKYKEPENGYTATTSTGTYTPYALTDLPNRFTGTNVGDDKNFEYALPYVLPVTEGKHNIFFKTTKRHNDIVLTSTPISKQVIYDKTPPTGTVKIDDGGAYVSQNEVKLTITTADNLSGVDKMKIVEEDVNGNIKEKIIEDPPASGIYDWTLASGGTTAQVSVVLYDNAGNTNIIYSQEVKFGKLKFHSFELTNNRNPVVYHSGNPFKVKTWQWDGASEPMLAGSSFDFNIFYTFGNGLASDYLVNGGYTVTVRSADGSYIYTDTQPYANNQRLDNGFSGLKVKIPANAPNGALVLVSSTIDSTLLENTAVKDGFTFDPAYIGTVGDTLENAVNKEIEFNEIN